MGPNFYLNWAEAKLGWNFFWVGGGGRVVFDESLSSDYGFLTNMVVEVDSFLQSRLV